MGVRFRKSVKICKGVKVNFSKSGASLSLGGKGCGATIGTKGTRVRAGIPGTGISYSTKLGATSHSHSKSTSRSTTSKPVVQLPKQVGVQMNDKGKVIIIDENGNEITNQSLVRKIKATPQYQAQVVELDRQRRQKIDEMVRDSEAENQRFINIFELSAVVDPILHFQNRLNTLKPAEYICAEFDAPAPTLDAIKAVLTTEAETAVKGSIFTIRKLRKQYVESNLDRRFADARSAWETERAEFYDFQEEQKKIADEAAFEECEQQKAFLAALIDGEESAVSEVFDSWIGSCELPVEINISYDWNKESGVMMLDVDLPEIEHLATTKLIKADNGNLKEKKKTVGELRGEYATLVFGLAIFISSHAFNVSPAIKKILISGYTQRRDKEGLICDDYIYSIKFPRGMFEQRDLTHVLPNEFCLSAESKCNMTSTAMFKKIVPFDIY